MARIDPETHAPRILVAAGPALGDILLATPMFASLRRAWPAATLHVLVYRGQEGILEGNPDIDAVIAAPKHPGAGDYVRLLRRILRRYDLAVSTRETDRFIWYAFFAGRKRIAFVPAHRDAWKRWVTTASVPYDPEGPHALARNASLAALLGIEFRPDVRLPRETGERGPNDVRTQDLLDRYAVLHMTPGLPYKGWTREGWMAAAAALEHLGLSIVFTGGTAADELALIKEIAGSLRCPTVSLAGRLRFAELTSVVEDCVVYAGTDTVTTHIAAATGVPTVALYGPESPRVWGPWPRGYRDDASPWRGAGEGPGADVQRVGNVTVLQSPVPCGTCRQGRCLRRRERQRICSLMRTLEPAHVVSALEAAAASRQRASGGQESAR